MNENNTYLSVAETRRPSTLLSAFDEIAETSLKAARGRAHSSLQSYLDGWITIDNSSFTRRAILIAIHDMKEDLDAPQSLREEALAELLSLKVSPAPELRLYRDLATALLRMEVVIRFQAIKNNDTKRLQ